MAVMLNRRPAPRGSFSFARSGYKIPAPPKPKPAPKPKLPGSPGWSQAGAYGWLGNTEGVKFATPNQYSSPYAVGNLGGGGGGGGGGDYAGMIGGDYEVQDAETSMAERMASLRSGFQTNLRQALVDLGITDQSKLGSLGQYIDADTISKAAQNKYSTTATIAAQEAKNNAQTQASLAARGLLSSGQLTKSSGDITAEAEKGRFGALRSFLESGATGLGQIADQEYQLARGVAQARAAAAARAAEWGMMGGGGGYGGGYGDYGADQSMGGLIPMPRVTATSPSRPGLAPKLPVKPKATPALWGPKSWARARRWG